MTFGPITPDAWILLAASPLIGSFLGMLVYRLPEGMPIAFARSACTTCHAPLGVIDLIPVLGWLIRGGKCSHCGEPISPVYPLIELGTIAVALWALTATSGTVLWLSFGIGSTLIVLAVIDWRTMTLPDALTLPLIAAGLVAALFLWPEHFSDHAMGAAAGYAIFFAVEHLYARLRGRPGLGRGDSKLLAAAGAWVEWRGLPGVVLIAAVSALATFAGWTMVKRLKGEDAVLAGDMRIPFGPFLCIGLWLTWLYGPIGLG